MLKAAVQNAAMKMATLFTHYSALLPDGLFLLFILVMRSFPGRAEGDARIARRAYKLSVFGHSFNLRYGFCERHSHDVGCLKRDHPAVFPGHESPDCTRAEVGRQHTIKSVRATSALKMPEHNAASLFAGN